MRILAWPAKRNFSRNPYQTFLYNSIERTNRVQVDEFTISNLFLAPKYQIFHIHWPDVFIANSNSLIAPLKIIFLRFLFTYFKVFKTKVVWTAHNLKRGRQNNDLLINRYFWPWFIQKLDGVIYLTENSREESFCYFPELKEKLNIVVPHGHYRPLLMNRTIREEIQSVRQQKNCQTILFFGSIVEYKNPASLVKAFSRLKNPNIRLKILGKVSSINPDENLTDELEKLPIEKRKNIVFEDRFLEEKELIQEVMRADIVVLPFKKVFNSGSAIFSLSFGTPVLVSDVPAFRELEKIVEPGWVYLFKSSLKAGDICKVLDETSTIKSENKYPELRSMDWGIIGKKTVEFYQTVS